jgi:hypothetical protein
MQHGSAVDVAVRDLNGCKAGVWRPFVGRPTQRIRATGVNCGPTRPLRGRSVVVDDASTLPLLATTGSTRAELGFDGVIHVYRGRVSVVEMSRPVRTRPLKIALDRDHLVVLAEGTYWPDVPYRIEVYSLQGRGFLHSWPLLGRPTTLDLHGNVALFTARNSGGVFGLRLSDGKTTLFGPVQPGDTPQINRYGVVFQSNLYERLNRQGRVHMKFLPSPVIREDFAQTFDTLRPRFPIKAFAMDGPRVAVLLDAPGGACDPVRFWNVPWHSFVRINMFEDLTCAEGLQMGSELAIGGIGAAWMASEKGAQRIVVSDSKACIEEVAGTLGATATPPPLAGDGTLLAFGAPSGSHLEDGSVLEDESVVLINWKTKGRTIVQLPARVKALSLDQDRVAVARSDENIVVLGSSGAQVATLESHHPSAIALRGRTLVVATADGALDVWDVQTARRMHVWRLPEGRPTSLDAHYGIAVFSVGHSVYALRLDNGRTVKLGHAPSRAEVQIEAPGVVYEYNMGGRGVLKFVPFSAVERALRGR